MDGAFAGAHRKQRSAIRAADAKNADDLFTIGGDIYEACSNCHQKYLEAIVNANK